MTVPQRAALYLRVSTARQAEHDVSIPDLAAASGVKSATPGVRSSVRRWRTGWDSNPRYAYTYGGFQDRCLKPLGHPSSAPRT